MLLSQNDPSSSVWGGDNQRETRPDLFPAGFVSSRKPFHQPTVPIADLDAGRPYRAPFSVQEVVHVTVTPCWHFLQTSTH
jgi:hypothetical protein